MKTTLIIVGSARKGNSLFIGEYAKEYLSRKGISIDLIQLSDYHIDYCDGCLACDETGTCHKEDDVSCLIGRVKDANGVIFVSPTRWSLLSGDMKVFMDRWNPLAGRGIFDDKKSLIVTVGQTNRKDSESIERSLASLKSFSDDAGFQFCGEFAFEECLNSNDIKDKKDQITEFTKLLEKYVEVLL